MQLNLQNSPIKIGNATVCHIDNEKFAVVIRVNCNCSIEDAADPIFLEENTSPIIKYMMKYLIAEGFLYCTGNYHVHIAVITEPIT